MKHNLNRKEWEEKKEMPQELIEIWEAVGVNKMPKKTKTKYDKKKGVKND